MADHLRDQIRAAVVTALTGLTTTSTRVYSSRAQDMQPANLPGLRIYTTEESVEIESLGINRRRHRTLTLMVEACVKATSAPEDTIDDICKEVEIALDTANTLGGLCKWIEPTQFELELDGEADKSIAVGRMTFEVHYYTAKGSPDVPN